MKTGVYFELETGMRNPRKPSEIGYRHYSYYLTLAEAKADVRLAKLKNWRIVKSEVVAGAAPELTAAEQERETEATQ
jgi:hypothetical protein